MICSTSSSLCAFNLWDDFFCSPFSSLSASNLWENSFRSSLSFLHFLGKPALSCLVLLLSFAAPGAETPRVLALRATDAPPAITLLDPLEKTFFSKVLDYHGIPIKAHA